MQYTVQAKLPSHRVCHPRVSGKGEAPPCEIIGFPCHRWWTLAFQRVAGRISFVSFRWLLAASSWTGSWPKAMFDAAYRKIEGRQQGNPSFMIPFQQACHVPNICNPNPNTKKIRPKTLSQVDVEATRTSRSTGQAPSRALNSSSHFVLRPASVSQLHDINSTSRDVATTISRRQTHTRGSTAEPKSSMASRMSF